MKGLLTLLVLVAISAGVFALGSFHKRDNGKSLLNVADEVALTVETAMPKKGEITRIVQAPGDVEAVLEVEISSEIVSKIVEMPVEEGDKVKEGDLLCRLDDNLLRAAVESGEARVAQLRAAVVQAEAELEKAERDFNRQVRLSEAEATSDLEVRDYQTIRKRATALLEMRRQELAEAEAGLKRFKEDLKKTVITSPISGVISRLNAKQGEVVVTGTMNNPGTVIMSISDLSKMQVRARIDEVDVPLVKPNQKSRVYLQSDPDSPVPARVVRVAAKGIKQPGRDVVTFEGLLEVLSDDERIKPGMTANVEIEVARQDDAITVPIEAVVHRLRKDLPESVVETFDDKQVTLDLSERAKQGQYIKVMYVMEEEVARVRLIDSGIADTRRVEIRDGVTLDDTVIIGPYRSLDQLKDGKKVALSEKDKPKKEGAEEDDESEDQKVTKGDQKKQDEKDAQGEKEDEDQQSLAASSTP